MQFFRHRFRMLLAIGAMISIMLPISALAQGTPAAKPGDNQAGEATPATMASPAASPAAATSDGKTYSAYLVEGSCADMSKLPEPVESLSDATIQPGEQVGAKDGVTAASSTTLLEDWTVDDLIDSDELAVVLTTTGDNPEILGCAAVGGVIDEDGALSIVMKPMPGHKSQGVVYISDKEDGMRITIFVHPDK